MQQLEYRFRSMTTKGFCMNLKMKGLYFGISLILILSFQSCGVPEGANSTNSTSSEKATFTWINQNIIREKCLSCHNGSFAFAGLEFSSYEGVMESVVPGAPENSGFYTRAFRTETFTLSDSELTIIRQWINSGALNN